jgi:hypothetical protein
MDASRAVYDRNGNLLCPSCSAKDQIAEGDTRAVNSTAGSALGVLIGGVLSMTCFNPFLIVSFITVASGFGWLVMIARNPAHRARMGGKFIPCMIAVCVGFLLGAAPLLAALAIAGIALSH